MPRVSVIIPTYNCATYIAEALESILAQTYQDVEIIVIDDGSTDGTRALLTPYLDRIVYLYQENQGESVARNRGIQVSQGEYIAFLDADDLWLPTKLERQVAALDTYPEAVLVYSYSYTIDAGGERIRFRGGEYACCGEPGLHQVFDQLVMSNLIANPGTVLARSCFLSRTTAFNPAIQWGEDWELWLRLSLQGPFAFVAEPLACYRMRQPGRRLRIEASDEFVHQNEIILVNTFAMIPMDRADLLRLQPQAFGALYLRSAMYSFELGDVDRGSRYIGQAVQSDPDLAWGGNRFARRTADEGFRIADERDDLAEGLAFVNRVFDHSPSGTGIRRAYRSYALAEFHSAVAFSRFNRGDRAAARRHVLQAIRSHPRCALNGGLISIGVQALIGSKPWAGLRGSRGTGVCV